MLEARRRAYMQTLGIVQYVPTDAIEGAKESAWLTPEQVYPELIDITVSDEAVPETAINPDGVTSEPAVQSVSEPIVTPGSVLATVSQTPPSAAPITSQQAPQERSSTDTVPPSGNPVAEELPPPTPDIIIKPLDDTPIVVAPVVSVDRPLRFALTMVELPGQLMVLADLTDADAMGCSAMEYQLLQGVLKSVGLAAEPSQHLFRWPLINNVHRVQGKAEAAEGVQGFLMAKLEKLDVPNVLLLGDYASGFMVDSTTQVASCGVMTVANKQIQCFKTPSLQQMLNDWQCKPVAWQVLSQLKRTLG